MLWLKALHIIFVITWFAGLFYLPRLFVYHAGAGDDISIARFKMMERRLFYGIMTPSVILVILSGAGLLILNPAYLLMLWMKIKLACVLLLIIYHVYLGKLLYSFKHNQNQHSATFYRWINEIPSLFLIIIVILAVVKPF